MENLQHIGPDKGSARNLNYFAAAQFANFWFNVFCLQQYENDMPPYFKFLTIMAYYVFLNENVDVAIVEVGIGGEYDCTNVVR